MKKGIKENEISKELEEFKKTLEIEKMRWELDILNNDYRNFQKELNQLNKCVKECNDRIETVIDLQASVCYAIKVQEERIKEMEENK